MSAGTIERIEDAAASAPRDALAQVQQGLKLLFELMPWMQDLTHAEVLQMFRELHDLTLEARRTGDRTALLWAVEDWQATAEARVNVGLQEALARTDREFVPWTD